MKRVFSKNWRTYGVFTATTLFFCTALFLISVEPMYAAFENPVGNTSTTILQLLNNILRTVVYMLTPIVVLLIVYTGFLFLQAQGNPAKLTEARNSLLWSLIGAALVLGATAILAIAKGTASAIFP